MTNDQPNQTSRRAVLGAGLAAIGAVGVAFTQRAAAQEKLAQNLVQYQEMPKDGNECDACVNFVAPNGCKIVAGNINPKGWCVAFAPKA